MVFSITIVSFKSHRVLGSICFYENSLSRKVPVSPREGPRSRFLGLERNPFQLGNDVFMSEPRTEVSYTKDHPFCLVWGGGVCWWRWW